MRYKEVPDGDYIRVPDENEPEAVRIHGGRVLGVVRGYEINTWGASCCFMARLAALLRDWIRLQDPADQEPFARVARADLWLPIEDEEEV